jgi:hypothetical protein
VDRSAEKATDRSCLPEPATPLATTTSRSASATANPRSRSPDETQMILAVLYVSARSIAR